MMATQSAVAVHLCLRMCVGRALLQRDDLNESLRYYIRRGHKRAARAVRLAADKIINELNKQAFLNRERIDG